MLLLGGTLYSIHYRVVATLVPLPPLTFLPIHTTYHYNMCGETKAVAPEGRRRNKITVFLTSFEIHSQFASTSTILYSHSPKNFHKKIVIFVGDWWLS